MTINYHRLIKNIKSEHICLNIKEAKHIASKFLSDYIRISKQCSNNAVFHSSGIVLCKFLLEKHDHVISRRYSLQIAFSQTVLFFTTQTYSRHISYATIKAFGDCTDFLPCIEPGLVFIQVFLFIFPQQHIGHVHCLVP